MDKRHILDVLLTLREKLETCGGGLNAGQMRNYLVRNRFVMRWDYLRELLARQEDGDTVYFPNPFLSRELYKSANFFVILRLPQLKNKRDTDYFYEIVEGSLAAWTKEYAVFPLNEAACLAMGHLESDRAADAGIVHELQNAVKTYTNLSCQCLYSAGCRSIEDVGLLYREYLDGSFSRDNGQNREEEGGGRLNELERAIHAQDTREAARVTEELARELLGGGAKPDYMRRMCLRFFSLYEKEFRQLGETIDSLFDENLVERVMNMDGARQLAEYMTETGGRFMDALRKLSGKAYRKDIAEVIRFIRLHYAEALSLTYLAGLVNMNSVYFSRLFKQVTEVSFVEYLTRVRMERAKELLRGDYIKMEEVAGRVGYDDVQYFSKAFKKYEGISPSRFRENAAAEHRGNPLR